MSSFKIEGLGKLQKQLKQMEKSAKELSKAKEVSFDELFTPPRLCANTHLFLP